MIDFDTVVIGAGAAGLSAALTLARARRKVAVLDAGEPRNATASRLHGYLSRDGEDPMQLLSIGRAEVRRFGADVLTERVTHIEKLDTTRFVVHSSGARAVAARSVLVATGLQDDLPAIPGVREQWGKDVVHCPYCHGWEVHDGAIAVVGGDNRSFTMHQASLVRQWSSDVVFFPNAIVMDNDERLRLTARGTRVVEGTVSRLVTHGGRLQGVELSSGEFIARSTVFIGPQFSPRDDLLDNLGCRKDGNGWVITDVGGSTSVAGVWAAGNVVDSPAQLITAAADGAKAGISVNRYLLEHDVQVALVESTR